MGTQGKGGVLATKAVGTQGKGGVLAKEGGGNTRQRRCLGQGRRWKHTRQRRCLSREGGGNTRQRRCLGHEGSGNRRGKGGILATKAVKPRGEGDVLAAKEVENTQGTCSGNTRQRRCLGHKLETRRRRCLDFTCSGSTAQRHCSRNTRGTCSVSPRRRWTHTRHRRCLGHEGSGNRQWKHEATAVSYHGGSGRKHAVETRGTCSVLPRRPPPGPRGACRRARPPGRPRPPD